MLKSLCTFSVPYKKHPRIAIAFLSYLISEEYVCISDMPWHKTNGSSQNGDP